MFSHSRRSHTCVWRFSSWARSAGHVWVWAPPVDNLRQGTKALGTVETQAVEGRASSPSESCGGSPGQAEGSGGGITPGWKGGGPETEMRLIGWLS